VDQKWPTTALGTTLVNLDASFVTIAVMNRHQAAEDREGIVMCLGDGPKGFSPKGLSPTLVETTPHITG
jgi:hypothetical protein